MAKPIVEQFLKELEDAYDLVPNKIKENYKSLIDKVKTGLFFTRSCLAIVSTTFGYFFDPEEGLVKLSYEIATLRIPSLETFGLKNDIPKEMHPLVDEMEEYLKKAEQQIVKVQEKSAMLLKIADAFADNDFQISSREWKTFDWKCDRLDYEMGVCKQYLEAAQKALHEMEIKVTGKLLLNGTLAIAAVATGGVLTAATVQGAMTTWAAAVGNEAFKESCGATTVLGMATAGTYLVCAKLFISFAQYAECLNKNMVKFNSRLNKVVEKCNEVKKCYNLLKKVDSKKEVKDELTKQENKFLENDSKVLEVGNDTETKEVNDEMKTEELRPCTSQEVKDTKDAGYCTIV